MKVITYDVIEDYAKYRQSLSQTGPSLEAAVDFYLNNAIWELFEYEYGEVREVYKQLGQAESAATYIDGKNPEDIYTSFVRKCIERGRNQ